MSLSRQEMQTMFEQLKKIEHVNRKVWKSGHYKWANDINWEVQKLKDKIQEVIGQLE